MTSFRIKTSKLNTSNLKDVNATLNTSPVFNNINNTMSILLTPQMIKNSLTTPLLVIPSPGTGSYITIKSSTLFLNFNTITYSFPIHLSPSMNLLYSNGQDTQSNINGIIEVIFNNTNNFGFTLAGSNILNISDVLNSGIYLSTSEILMNQSNSNITLIINYNVYTL